MGARMHYDIELEYVLIQRTGVRVFVHTYGRFDATAEQFKAPAPNKPTYSIVRLRVNSIPLEDTLIPSGPAVENRKDS